MKKILLIGLVLSGIGTLMAQEMNKPILIDGFYAFRLSENSEYLASEAGGAAIMNLNDGEIIYYPDAYLGLGNAIANTGEGVGSRNNAGVIMSNNRAITPVPLREFTESCINAITPDGSRITGFLMNPGVSSITEDNVLYIPFYCDRDDEGNWGEVKILPYPKKDFFGYRPQYVTSVWISEDGKTILGQMTANSGHMCDPVVFRETADNEWECHTPTKHLFNPNNIELPADPELSMPAPPEYQDYMDPDMLEAYEEAMWEWQLGNPEYEELPDPLDYMTNQQVEDYFNAVDEYENFYENHLDEFIAYWKAYDEILKASPSFALNDLTINLSGSIFASAAITEDEMGNDIHKIYLFDMDDNGSIKTMDTPVSNISASQILSNGTIIAASGMMDVPTTYIMVPELGNEFMPIVDYFKLTHPSYVEWIENTIPYGSGLVTVNEDLTIFAGGLVPMQYAHLDDSASYYTSYIFGEGLPDLSGVEEVINNSDNGVFHIFNLQGMKVLTTQDRNEIQTLSPGIYIINGKKIVLK